MGAKKRTTRRRSMHVEKECWKRFEGKRGKTQILKSSRNSLNRVLKLGFGRGGSKFCGRDRKEGVKGTGVRTCGHRAQRHGRRGGPKEKRLPSPRRARPGSGGQETDLKTEAPWPFLFSADRGAGKGVQSRIWVAQPGEKEGAKGKGER